LFCAEARIVFRPLYLLLMPTPATNIFLTGAPSSGKTTVIKRLIGKLILPANGFFTEEERCGGKRVGFMMHTLEGKSGYLAHQDIASNFHIRRYGVSIKNIESIAVCAIRPVKNHLIIIDEIGKMECFSEKFCKAAITALDAPNIVVGTIPLGGNDFILEIKKRCDIKIHEVTLHNRDILPQILLDEIATLLN